jgi:hypothetical protein
MEDHMERNMKDFLNSLFGPLIKIGDNNSINLLHQSVKDFLISENLAEKDNPLNLNTFHGANSPYFHINPREANFQLALTCLRYLSLDEFRKGPITDIFDHLGELKHVLRQYPFLSYAASYGAIMRNIQVTKTVKGVRYGMLFGWWQNLVPK